MRTTKEVARTWVAARCAAWLSLSAAALSLSNASTAAADALPPPEPITCREGELVRHDHGGTRCALPYCWSDADCPEGASCPELRCVAYVPNPADFCRSSPKGPPDPCARVPEDRGPCRADEPRCDGDAECRQSQCVWGEAPPRAAPGDDATEASGGDDPAASVAGGGPPPASGGGCCGSTAARAEGLALPSSLLLVGLVTFGGRRR